MPSLRSGSVLHASIQNCFKCFEYIYILPFNNFGLTLIRRVQSLDGLFSVHSDYAYLPEIHNLEAMKIIQAFSWQCSFCHNHTKGASSGKMPLFHQKNPDCRSDYFVAGATGFANFSVRAAC